MFAMANGMRTTVALGNNTQQVPSTLPTGPLKVMTDPLEEVPKRRGLSRQISTSQPKLVSQSNRRKSIENILSSQGLRRNSLALVHDLKRNLSASNLAAFSDTNLSLRKAVPVRSYDTPDSSSSVAKHFFEQRTKRYFYQITEGCGSSSCKNSFCKSSTNPLNVSQDMAAIVSIQLASLQRDYFCASDLFVSCALPVDVFQSKTQDKRKGFLQTLYSTSPFASLFKETQYLSNPQPCGKENKVTINAGSKPPSGRLNLVSKGSQTNLKRDAPSSKLKFDSPHVLVPPLMRSGSIQDLSSSGDSIMWPELRSESSHMKGSGNQSTFDDSLSDRGHVWSGSSKGDLDSASHSACDSPELDGGDPGLDAPSYLRRSSSSLGGSTSRLRSSSHVSFGSGHGQDSYPILNPNTPPFTPSPVPPPTPRRLLSEQEALEETDDLRAFERSLSMEVAVDGDTEFSLTHLTLPMLQSAVDQYAQCGDNSFLLNTIRTVFTSSDALNLSFKVDDSCLSPIDMSAIRHAYKLLKDLRPLDIFLSVMTNALEILLMNLKREKLEADEISQLFILMENFLFEENHNLLLMLSQVLAHSLSDGAKNAFIHFLSAYSKENFLQLLSVFKNCLNSSLKPNHRTPN